MSTDTRHTASASLQERAHAAAELLLADYDRDVARGLYPPLAGIQRRCIEQLLALAWSSGGEAALTEFVERYRTDEQVKP